VDMLSRVGRAACTRALLMDLGAAERPEASRRGAVPALAAGFTAVVEGAADGVER